MNELLTYIFSLVWVLYTFVLFWPSNRFAPKKWSDKGRRIGMLCAFVAFIYALHYYDIKNRL